VTETNVFQLSQPGTFSDPLTEVLRNGARALLAQAVEAEISSLLSCHADKLTDDGRRRLVRDGHLPEREIMTGIGQIAVRCPRVRDRGGEGSERIRFLSTILPATRAGRRAWNDGSLGPKADGTYVMEFKTAAGEALAISIPRTETAVIRHFQERMPYGLFVPDVP
jgi:hypothetical protein